MGGVSTQLATDLAARIASNLTEASEPPMPELVGVVYVLDPADVVLSGGKIVTWNGPTNITQGTDALRAAYNAEDADFGGRPSATFAGAQNYDFPSMAAFTEGEMFAVVKVASDPPGSDLASGCWRFGGTPNTAHYPYTDGVVYLDFGSDRKDGLAVNPAQSLAVAHVHNAWSATNNWAVALNGSVLMSTASSSVTFPTNPRMGGNSNMTAVYSGKLAHLVLCSAVQTPEARAAMVAWLVERFSL